MQASDYAYNWEGLKIRNYRHCDANQRFTQITSWMIVAGLDEILWRRNHSSTSVQSPTEPSTSARGAETRAGHPLSARGSPSAAAYREAGRAIEG